MDEDIFKDLSVINAKKTYIKKTNKLVQPRGLSENKNNTCTEERLRPLTTKVAVKFLLEGKLKTKVCRYCLNITPGLSELDQIMKIGSPGAIYKVSIRDIVASFHPFKVIDDPNFPNKICQKCLDKALSSYLFTQQCERAERAMLNCFDDIYEKFEKLDPIDRPKKRGRQKLNPNYNVLHAEHYKVIDYAEPIINIVNIGAESVTKEPELNELECKKCWQVLPNLESLLNHETTHPKTMWYHCRLCGKSFPKVNQLKKHNHRVHVLGKEVVPFSEKGFKCNECDHFTESFVQHLQHIEKHKFKKVMENLLKKKMDKLCAVCFNEGIKMMDMENMVCIHGCHPDLMGDKTLYSLLASTLPDTKSYKYKELFIPSKAQIMTISKRHNTNEKPEGMKIIKPLPHYQFKEDFIFSYPIIVSKCILKTNHFYFYVYSDPEYENNDKIANESINMDITETVDMYTPTKLVEVVDISEVKDDENTKLTDLKSVKEINNEDSNPTIYNNIIQKSEPSMMTEKIIFTENTKRTDFETNKEFNNEDSNPNMEQNMMTDEFIFTNSKFDNDEVKKSEVNVFEYKFSKPVLVTEVNGRTAVNITQITYPETDFEPNNSVRVIEKEPGSFTPNDNEIPRKNQWDTEWLFKSCTNNFRSRHLEKENCKFCWIFKKVGICDYCKKPTKDDNNINKDIEKVLNKEKRNEDINFGAIERDKTWPCGICLSNNNYDRLTCHCCGATKSTEFANMKIAFGNKTFFPPNITEKDDSKRDNKIEIKDKTQNETVSGDLKINLSKINFIEDSNVMDCKSFSEDLNELDNKNHINMDIETNTTFKTIATKNESEAMDIEENPITLDWNTAILNFNISATTLPVNNIPTDKPIIQFNMGFGTGQKAQLKKLRRVKNMSKAFHK